MDEMTYQQRVNMIAEEMARTLWPTLQFEGDQVLGKKNAIDTFLPSARIAVAKMAEAYDEGFQFGIEYDLKTREGISLYEKLREQGLLPESENPAWKE